LFLLRTLLGIFASLVVSRGLRLVAGSPARAAEHSLAGADSKPPTHNL
jgi:hypothetical protein